MVYCIGLMIFYLASSTHITVWFHIYSCGIEFFLSV